MKRILITLIAIVAVTASMNAQKVEFSEDADLAFGNDVFFVEPISYLGYGYHLYNSEMNTAMNVFNSEFFINAMELGLRPFKGGLLAIGVDYKLDQYRLDSNNFWGAENGNSAWIRSVSMSPFKEVKD